MGPPLTHAPHPRDDSSPVKLSSLTKYVIILWVLWGEMGGEGYISFFSKPTLIIFTHVRGTDMEPNLAEIAVASLSKK